MGPLNEFQRRILDVSQQNIYLQQANAGGPPPEYFGYSLTIGSAGSPLTNGVTRQGIITIQADAWFLWEYLSVGVVIPDTAGFGGLAQVTDGGNLLLQIANTGTGDELYSGPPGFSGFPAVLSSGSPLVTAAGIPYIYPTPVLLPPNSNISVSVTKLGTNVGADNPDPVGAYIMLNGARVQVWS